MTCHCNEKSNNLIIIYSQCLLSTINVNVYLNVEFIYLYEYLVRRNNSG